MPMLCPSIPIDKNKQGGRNYDSSNLTDFKKICLVSNDDTTRGNQQTDLTERHRARVMASSLRSIPRFLPPSDVINDRLPTSLLQELSGISFYVVYKRQVNAGGVEVAKDYTYINNIYGNTSSPPVPRTNTFGEAFKRGNSDSIPSLPAGSNRQRIANELNTRLTVSTGPFDHTFTLSDSGADKFTLVASLTNDGKLRISISKIDGATLVPRTTPIPGVNQHVGIFFGTAPNGSTKLGVTSGERDGMTGGALMILPGESSATAPFKIGGD